MKTSWREIEESERLAKKEVKKSKQLKLKCSKCKVTAEFDFLGEATKAGWVNYFNLRTGETVVCPKCNI